MNYCSLERPSIPFQSLSEVFNILTLHVISSIQGRDVKTRSIRISSSLLISCDNVLCGNLNWYFHLCTYLLHVLRHQCPSEYFTVIIKTSGFCVMFCLPEAFIVQSCHRKCSHGTFLTKHLLTKSVNITHLLYWIVTLIL